MNSGIFSPIIPKNKPISTTHSKNFYSPSFQKNAKISSQIRCKSSSNLLTRYQGQIIDIFSKNLEYDAYISSLKNQLKQIKKERKQKEEELNNMKHKIVLLRKEENNSVLQCNRVKDTLKRLEINRIKNEEKINFQGLKKKKSFFCGKNHKTENLYQDCSKTLNTSTAAFTLKKNLSSSNLVSVSNSGGEYPFAIFSYSSMNKSKNKIFNQKQAQRTNKKKNIAIYDCDKMKFYYEKNLLSNYNNQNLLKNKCNKCSFKYNNLYKKKEEVKEIDNYNSYELNKTEKEKFKQILMIKLQEDEKEKKRIELELKKIQNEEYLLINQFNFDKYNNNEINEGAIACFDEEDKEKN